MSLKSRFGPDLKRERKLTPLLDRYYKKHLKHYSFERISDIKSQLAGIDLVFIHKTSKQRFYIDEKAQLDYINEDLPTFAFEINYQKNTVTKQGWFFDTAKKTDFYALVTGIYSDEPNAYTSCRITMVNRKKLLRFLNMKMIDTPVLESYCRDKDNVHGKIEIKELKQSTEGYLYLSNNNKAEKPLNLILRLDFLILNGLARRLV